MEKKIFVILTCGAAIICWVIGTQFALDLGEWSDLGMSPRFGIGFYLWFLTIVLICSLGVLNLGKISKLEANTSRALSTKDRRYQLALLVIMIPIAFLSVLLSTLYVLYKDLVIWVYSNDFIYYLISLGEGTVFIACIGIMLLIITRGTGIKTEIKAPTP